MQRHGPQSDRRIARTPVSTSPRWWRTCRSTASSTRWSKAVRPRRDRCSRRHRADEIVWYIGAEASRLGVGLRSAVEGTFTTLSDAHRSRDHRRGASWARHRIDRHRSQPEEGGRMFTGIVTGARERHRGDRRPSEVIRIVRRPHPTSDGLGVGDSVAVNGVCLTAVIRRRASASPSRPSRRRCTGRRSATSASGAPSTSSVRCQPHDGRFDGHIVQGHVDGVGTITSRSTPRVDRSAFESLPDGARSPTSSRRARLPSMGRRSP